MSDSTASTGGAWDQSGQPPPSDQDATLILNAAVKGDAKAVNDLLGVVYEQLRSAARAQLALERPGHTLSATALVHEAYLKLIGPRDVPWQGRGHFYAAASEAMRRILLDHARARGRLKRGGGAAPDPGALAHLAGVADLAAADSDEIVRFDSAFRRLEEESPEGAAVVRLRFYAGLSVEQTAEALGLSTSTMDRRWSFARAWLYRQLYDGTQG